MFGEAHVCKGTFCRRLVEDNWSDSNIETKHVDRLF
jgi:hypothetical protein